MAYKSAVFKYPNKRNLKSIYLKLNKSIIEQEQGKRSLIESLYQMSVMKDANPRVILFLGSSGVGKTETAKTISKALDGKLTRIQISMMHTQEAYNYMLGSEHSRPSFARDLLSRESNLILLDEFDKVDPLLYNAFYQLFDDGYFVGTNYEVDMRKSIIIRTSNFKSENEAKQYWAPQCPRDSVPA